MAEQYTPGWKGKGRQLSEAHSDSASPLQIKPSMADRIKSSASALARDAIGSSNGHAAATIASSSTLGSKSQASGTSTSVSAWTDTASVRQAVPMTGNGAGLSDTLRHENFRSQSVDGLPDFDFENFLADGGDTFMSFPRGNWKPTPWKDEFNIAHPIGEHHDLRDDAPLVADTRGDIDQRASDFYDDGAEVRLLLSDPSFNIHTDTSGIMSVAEPSQSTVDDLFSENLGTEAMKAYNTIKSSLPAPPVHKPVPRNHPLNLRPLSDAEKLSLQDDIRNFDLTNIDRSDQYTEFSSKSQREEWISEWDSVLNKYTDEVWADLLPVIEAARDEVDEARAGAKTLDTRAIARLKMILWHVSALV